MPPVRSGPLATPGVVLKACPQGMGSIYTGVRVCCIIGLRSNEFNCCDTEFKTSSSNNVCLWVCGINIKGGLVAELEVSSRNGQVWLILVGLKFKHALEKSGPCFFDVFWFPARLPGNAYKLFAEKA
eukprot:384114-Pelagomonas_calceolata.AAC.1